MHALRTVWHSHLQARWYPGVSPCLGWWRYMTVSARRCTQKADPAVARHGNTNIPSIPTCPLPSASTSSSASPPSSCSCSNELPPKAQNLDISREGPMRVSPHTRHVVISTARCDWNSLIEKDAASYLLPSLSSVSPSSKAGDVLLDGRPTERANLARALMGLVGPGGEFHQPGQNILITNSSSVPKDIKGSDDTVIVYPQHVDLELRNDPAIHEKFVRDFLVAESGELGDGPKLSFRPLERASVFICGHEQRDSRCGIMGPLIYDRFLDYLANRREQRMHGGIDVRICSHIGGHKWAGNVIVYIPPQWKLADGTHSPLGRKGVWYGRVEPKHVEGIVECTIGKGQVIEDLLRGITFNESAPA